VEERGDDGGRFRSDAASGPLRVLSGSSAAGPPGWPRGRHYCSSAPTSARECPRVERSPRGHASSGRRRPRVGRPALRMPCVSAKRHHRDGGLRLRL